MGTFLYGAIGAAVIFFIGLIWWLLSLRRVVSTNEVHIVRRGSKTLVYGAPNETPEHGASPGPKNSANSYYCFPTWMPWLGVTVTVMPLEVFGIDIIGYEAFDKDRVPFVVDIQSFFRISNYEVAATRISSISELRKQLLSIVQGAVRTILAQDLLNAIMGERSKYGQQFTDEVKDELKSWGVETVKNIELMDVRDAKGEEVIANIMAKKKSEIKSDSRITVAQNNQKAREAEIAAEREIALKEQEKEKEVGLRKAAVKKEVGIADEESAQAVKSQQKVTKEREMEVQRVEIVKQAEIDKEKKIINAEGSRRQTEIDAEADKKKQELAAEAELIKVTKTAEGRKISALKNAEGIKSEGEAKAEAEKKMQLASVEAQLTLAAQIGENAGYQKYLIEVRKIEASEKVGITQAENLKGANIKIIAGAGNVTDGVSSAMDVLSPKGGFNIAGAIEALGTTEIGQDLLQRLGSKAQNSGKK